MLDLYMYKYDKIGAEYPSDTSTHEGGQMSMKRKLTLFLSAVTATAKT